MSCENGSTKIACLAGRLGAGIAQLAGKRGFYAGLALGGVGLAGAGLVALARRRSAPTRRPGPIPQLAARQRIEPATKLTAANRCAGCQTPAQGGKAGPWYQIEARAYCQDCAPAAARQAGVDLAAPKVVAAAFSGQKGAALSLPSAARPSAFTVTPLPAEHRVETRLAPSRLKVFSGRADEAGRAIFIETNGYAVTRPDYRGGVVDTGLAITPGLKQEGGRFREDPDRWHIIHIASGITLPGQYGALEQAHDLAGILAQVDWTRPQAEFSTAELRRVGATISGYHEALAKLKPGASGGQAAPPAQPAAPAAPQSLTGQLVADPKGGVGRIIEDHGATLFMVDARGERCEVGRHEIRPPSLSDYEGAGVAQAFDPAAQRGRTCARCGQSTDSAPAGSKWHIMSYQVFCGQCGPAHAKEEGYALADEIGVETA